MAIEWPAEFDLGPNQQTWKMTYNNRAFNSSLSNAQQIVGYPGAYWSCDMTFGTLLRDKERVISAFLGRLQGMFGTFRLPAFTRFRDDDIGQPFVVTANALATTMQLSGMHANASVFSFGDYITVSGEMFEVVESVRSSGEGTATLQLNKRIRSNIASGAPIEYRRPYSVMRLSEDSYSITRQPLVSNTTISCREAF